MVGDELLNRAVSRVLQRSERQEDIQKLIGTFVDLGILAQLENHNNQAVYGRRGTGKTHVLRVLGSRFNAEAKATVVYIDARALGSTSQFADPTLPIGHRCLALFRDVLAVLHDGLLEHIIEHPSSRATDALAACDQLGSIAVEHVQRLTPQEVTASATGSKERSAGIGATISSSPMISADAKQADRAETTRSATYRVATEDKIIFPALYGALDEVLKLADTTLDILFDEWSSLPLDVAALSG